MTINCEKCGKVAEKLSRRWCIACRPEASKEARLLQLNAANSARNGHWKTLSPRKQLKLIAEYAAFYLKYSNATRTYKRKKNVPVYCLCGKALREYNQSGFCSSCSERNTAERIKIRNQRKKGWEIYNGTHE